MVGIVFLRQIGAATLPKCPLHTSVLPILSNRLRSDFKGYSIIPFVVLGNFFSFQSSGQRKEAKEDRNIKIGFSTIANYSIGCVFQTEKPSKRCSMFSNSINAISSFLHCPLNPLKHPKLFRGISASCPMV
jgi:hypothetical protein